MRGRSGPSSAGGLVILLATACGDARRSPATPWPTEDRRMACGDKVCNPPRYCISITFAGGADRGPDEPPSAAYECADQPRAIDARSPTCQAPVDHQQRCLVKAP